MNPTTAAPVPVPGGRCAAWRADTFSAVAAHVRTDAPEDPDTGEAPVPGAVAPPLPPALPVPGDVPPEDGAPAPGVPPEGAVAAEPGAPEEEAAVPGAGAEAPLAGPSPPG
ncbi:hypothetical protein ACF1A5_05085 [Streptomyces sp. NPDC014864]|uniref:hypothetical protein n=1 Tax=Streptomyces sp. NPDC014864 TaxID=3364924 RepID=UPI0036FB1AC6